MEQVFRKVTPQEAMELENMFPGVRVDYTQFKVICDQYTQSTKTSVDTKTDNRCDLYIPPKATILKSWHIVGDMQILDVDGNIEDPAATNGAAGLASSWPETIERVHILHGNSSGEILWECTNHFHQLAKMRMQGMKEASEYGFVIVDGEDVAGVAIGAAPGLFNPSLQVTQTNNDATIWGEYETQVYKIQQERHLKYKLQGRLTGDYFSGTGKATLLGSDILPGKVPYFPLLLSSRGITIRMDLRTDAFHRVPKRSLTCANFNDGDVNVDIPDLRFKFTNLTIYTVEIVPSLDFQKALLELQMQKGFFAYPTYSLQGQQVDITSNNIQVPIDAAGSRIEFTDLTFVNTSDIPYSGKILDAQSSLGAVKTKVYDTNELILCGFGNEIGSNKQLNAGVKANAFLPRRLNTIKIDISGQDHPNSSTYDNIGDNPQNAYKLYKEMFEEDERKISFRDWIFRYFKM